MNAAVLLTLVLVAIASALPKPNLFNGREIRPEIVGGEEAGEHEFPYFVHIWMEYNVVGHLLWVPICGGVIYDENRIITNAACATSVVHFNNVIIAGNNNEVHPKDDPSYGQFRTGSGAIVHDQYSSVSLDYDIGIIYLNAPLVHNESVQPIGLAKNSSVPFGEVVICGFGGTESGPTEKLRKTTLKVIIKDECQQGYEGIFSITESMVCASQPSKSIAWGDDGGPLVAKDEAGQEYLAGVGSFVKEPYGEYPSVFTNVAHCKPWLDSVLNP